MKYLKLNPLASSFTDAATGIALAGDEVIAVDEVKMTHKNWDNVKKALADGHLRPATEADFNKYQNKIGKLEDASEAQRNKDLKRANENKLLEEQKNKGKDLKKETKVKEEVEEEEPEDDEDETEEDDEDQDTDGDGDIDDDDLSDGEMRDALKESPLVKDDQKKGLKKLKGPKLLELYKTIFSKK